MSISISKVSHLCLNMSDIPLQGLNGSRLLRDTIAAYQYSLEVPVYFARAQCRYERRVTRKSVLHMM